jgi:ankyrin repeat protein
MRLVRGFFISMLCLRGVLIVAGQDLPAREAVMRGVPPLTAAVIRQDLARLQQLLDAGEDPTQKDDQGFTPWMWALQFRENEALKLLLATIPSISATDVAARQKIAVAASLDDRVAVRALLAKGVPSMRQMSPRQRRFSSRLRMGTRTSWRSS